MSVGSEQPSPMESKMSKSPSARIARSQNRAADLASLRDAIRYCDDAAERTELEATLARLAR